MLSFDRFKWLKPVAALFVVAMVLWASGVSTAIVPALVPVANKQGNSSVFQLAGTNSGVAAALLCDDANGNATTTGCAAGGAGTPGATLFSSTTSVGPNDTNVETSLIGTVVGSTTIAANTFQNGAVLEVYGQGFFSLPAVADALTLKAKCGGTVLATTTFTPPAGALTNGTFRLWLMITGRGTGAGGSFITNGLAEFSGSALTPTDSKVLNTSTVAFDFTTSCAFDMTATWAAAQVAELITGTNVAAWIPGAPVTSVDGLTGAVKSPHAITFVIDGGGAVIATGDIKSYPSVNFACTINRADISADQAGDITVDVWKANAAIPVAGNKISAAAPITIPATNQLAQSGSLAGWTTAVAVNDVFGFSVATVHTVTRVTGQIWCR
jgi:hypothetical protein